jgi:phosphohistidine phosphatase
MAFEWDERMSIGRNDAEQSPKTQAAVHRMRAEPVTSATCSFGGSTVRLLVVRHAIAEDREEFAKTGEPDERRPLTKKGRRRMRRGARGLRRLVPDVDVLATSPYVRAADTAQIIADAYGGGLAPATLATLTPDASLEATCDWLRTQPAESTVAIVGHDPHLPHLVSWLLGGATRPLLEIDKGGACLLVFDDAPSAGAARLCWLLESVHLRRLRRR